ncbi:AraC family transcriptional regulator ligand-binding domain-containing protein [Novosphingobium sp. YJ-S2-02]|uniref:AraC family transcriptional regulator ligand-binding domain-containing protein n=1 Tax=Novosphingobium aureum TaxID=2792964 RepID=A0A931HD56_9SPHN|nr:AraC family transcriptional regulator ligand-binding domain-containing protein [Novosphingobium aureum]MBH0113907.1 AraC family transcriptional regulator ligand-binding domain-containing protein [Novosphingobium aureum]
MAGTLSKEGPSQQAYDIVHARMLDQFEQLVSELGGDPAMVAREAAVPLPSGSIGGTAEVACAGARALTYGDAVRLLEVAAARLGCSDFGLRLAARQNGPGIFGPLGAAMRNARNYGEALDYAAHHVYAHSLAARVWRERVGATGQVFVGHDILISGTRGRRQAIEQILLAGHLVAMALTGGRARARQVCFRHEAMSSMRVYRRYFGCEVRFGQRADGISFDAQDLAAPIVAPDPYALAQALARIEHGFTHREPPFHARVRAVVLRQLAVGGGSCESVAGVLCMHVRTLHRRLRAEGTSISRIKDEVRRELLGYYLEDTSLALPVICERLGFAEHSVMTRYCRRHLGAPPSVLRARLAGTA